MKKVRVRIAPSPTGEDLHIGNVYTALINYAFARKHKGRFIVRIEDTDRKRFIEGAEGKIKTSLEWFGLLSDESPWNGGDFGPYRQSERLEIYRKYALELVDKERAYFCFCSAEDIEKMRAAQKLKNAPFRYDGKCSNIKKAEARKRVLGAERHVIRLKVPKAGETSFNDLIRGKIQFQNSGIDDQVLLKSDGYPTYHLAVVIDDYLMKISHVVRAEEWISSTPKHVLLYEAFGWDLPVFAHGPILRNPDKSKLSKRKNPVWASWYIKEGFLPEAVINYLALMGWSMPDDKEIFTFKEMIAQFELSDLKTVGPSFDIRKLEWLNGEYIRQKNDKELSNILKNYYGFAFPHNIIEKTVPLIRERIKKISEYRDLCLFFTEKPRNYEIDIRRHKNILEKIHRLYEREEMKDANEIGDRLMALAKQLSVSFSEFFMILRIAVSGRKITPPLNQSLEILGREEVLERLKLLI